MEIEEDMTELEGDVNFLFAEQVIQDERLLGVEQEIDVIDTQIIIIDNELEGELTPADLLSHLPFAFQMLQL